MGGDRECFHDIHSPDRDAICISQDEVDDWSSPSSAASNLIILLLAFIVATSVIGTLVKLLITCIFLLIEGFKYSAVCIFLMLFAVFLA